MEILNILWGALIVVLASLCVSVSNSGASGHPILPVDAPLPPSASVVAAEEDVGGRADEEEDDFFDPYAVMKELSDDDWDELEDIRFIMDSNKQQRNVKFSHDRKEWSKHVDMLLQTNEFHKRFRMSYNDFESLLEALEEALTVSFAKSRASTDGNDPIYPEIIMACGLRFLALGDNPATLSDLYGMSVSSAKRVINMFLDAVDFNTSFAPLQVKLPDPNDHEALHALAFRWSEVSSAFGLMNGHLGAIDGWLPRTEMPWDVPNQTDYFSGHYQCYGLNVQALCDPDLLFLYVGVVAPGKTNDIRAFTWCQLLLDWLEALPPQYYIGGDNAYCISRRLLIPFNKNEIYHEDCRTYNFYLSQLRMRIEMAFGLLTTKWRRLRMALNFSSAKNAKIIRVCTKLHNYCIRRKHERGEGRIGIFTGTGRPDPKEYGIIPLHGEGNRTSIMGYLDTHPDDDPVDISLLIPDFSRRNAIMAEIDGRSLKRPEANIIRNE